jgi:tetratricopeptide (TPR) repeat protein
VINRANLQRARGDKVGAAATLRPLVDRLTVAQPDDRQTLVAMNLLAGVLHGLGKLDEAQPFYQAAVDGFAKRGEKDSPDALLALNNLGALRYSRGERETVLPLLEEVLATRRRVLGDSHPSTIGAMCNVASVHYGLGHFAPAIRAGGAQLGQPPARMLPARRLVALGHRQQLVAAAQEVAQHAIHQRLVATSRQPGRRRHRLVDRGMGILRPRLEPLQRHQQQAARGRIGERPRHQMRQEKVTASMAAQCAVSEIHRGRSRRRRQVERRQRRIEIAPADDRRHGARGGIEGESQ